MSHIRKRTAVISLLSASFLLSACQAADTTQDTTEPDYNVHAELDVATSRVIFPSTPFQMTHEEDQIIATAYNVAVNKCAQEELGINAQYPEFISLQSDVYEMFYEYGPWTEDMATRFGYVAPMTEADMRANGIVRDNVSADTQSSDAGIPELSDAELERVNKECRTKPEVKQFDPIGIDNLRPAALDTLNDADMGLKVKKNKRGQAVFEDLKECYSRNGIAFEKSREEEISSSPIEVSGANHWAINEEQIKLALKDVACKNEVNMIQRLADIRAAYEAPVVQENEKEFQAYRKQIDDLVTKANAYINENKQYLYYCKVFPPSNRCQL